MKKVIRLTNHIEYNNFESREHIVKAERLESLFKQYCTL